MSIAMPIYATTYVSNLDFERQAPRETGEKRSSSSLIQSVDSFRTKEGGFLSFVLELTPNLDNQYSA